MKIHCGTLRWAREAWLPLLHLPECVRRFALERCSVIITGGVINGVAFRRDELDGEWVIALAAREGLADTLKHELGHAISGHDGPSALHEYEAAWLASEWGARGSAADPSGSAANFTPERRPTPVAIVSDHEVAVVCTGCGRPCIVSAPTAVGITAAVGIECDCGFTIVRIENLVPCICGERGSVTWAEGATPENPSASWSGCSCGTTASRRIRSAPARTEPEPEPILPATGEPASYYVRQAARTLRRVEQGLRNGKPTGWGADLGWARVVLTRAIQELPHGDHRQLVEGVVAQLTVAGTAMVAGDQATAAGVLAGIITTLNNNASIQESDA